MPGTLVEIVGAIVNELTPLNSEERKRAIQAAMTLLGESGAAEAESVDRRSVEGMETMPARVRSWLRQNSLSIEQVEQVFHINNNEVEIIAEIPGRNNKEKVRAAYILTGISNFLLTGEQRFDDVAARALCERVGIYDSTNHAKYMKGGNEFVGSRNAGWTLTAPGLRQGAIFISELSAA